MARVTEAQIKSALKRILDPHTNVDIVEMGMVKRIDIKGKKIKIAFCPTSPFCPLIHFLKDEVKRAVQKAAPGFDTEVKVVTYLE